ncbi:AAA family ATPase [Kitasatospora sp. NBC_00315]|uniref:ATP-binding protein n=1 Tax=Kitasatospora sp. NBC_00315 TaxID=2975963 RepID=UPI00324F982B
MHERERELRAAEEAVGSLRGAPVGEPPGAPGAGGILLYAGRPGLGKTALLAEVRRSAAHDAGCTVLFARGGERRRNDPFHVVRQLLRPVVGTLSDAERQEAFGSWGDIVGPAVGLTPPAGRLDPQGVRDGLDFVLARLARLRAPLVLMVDDLHWADLESLGWLAAFAVHTRELPVLLVLAHRDEFADDAAPLHQLVARAGTRYELRPLKPASVADLVRGRLGKAAEDAFCREVWTVTGGNPFETATLLRRVLEQDLAPVEENSGRLRPLAAEARGMTLRGWLDRLGAGTLQFAWAAAMLGTGIRPELAAAICAQGPAAAARSVGELRRHRVLTDAADGRLEFVHPLIATSVYQSMPAATRTAMHGVAATEIQNAGQGLLAASRHLLETVPDGDHETVAALRGAAAEHLAIGAPDAARRCLRRAMSEPPADEERAEVRYELGCSSLLTDPAATVDQLRLALEERPGLRPELRVDATFRLAQALAHSNHLGEAARVCREEALATPPGPGRQRLDVAHFMFTAFQAREDDGPARSRSLARFASALDGGERSTVSAVRVLHCWDLTLRGRPATEAVATADLALEDGRPHRSLGWTNTLWGFELPGVLGISYLYADRADRAEALFDEAVWAYQVAGWSGAHLGFAYCLMGLLRFRQGNLREAEDFLRRALRSAERIAPGIPLQWFAVGVLADTLLARGRTDEALALARKYSFEPPFPTVMVLPDAPTLHGRLLLAGGDPAGARVALTEAGALLDTRGWQNPVWAPWTGHLALATLGQDRARARDLADEALRRAERTGTHSAVGSALRVSAAVRGDAESVELLEEAVRRLAQSPAAYEHAIALVDLGAALRRADRGEEARRALERGLELARTCGADALAERARLALAGL